MQWDSDAKDILGVKPRFVVFASYGNDSVALIQWAREQELTDVVVVYSDTDWAAPWWRARVEKMEAWVHTLGFYTSRTTSMGFKELARFKKGFPTQRYQWCSYILKIEPAERWLKENDPDCRAVCLVGVRHEESTERKDFPAFLLNSKNHGGRVMIAPLATLWEEQRDEILKRAGVEPLPHRSMECSPCINSNKKDLQALTEESIREVEQLEKEMHDELGLTRNGKPRTLFRPHRHGGAVGIREVIKWAHSKRGEYEPPVNQVLPAPDMWDEDGPDEYNCGTHGYCAT
ncbi:putative PAPS reductase protein [Rhizobium phage RHph_X2_30]|nr:putative PAPS reductase protein [Rhizobium phage RHph_X2_30]